MATASEERWQTGIKNITEGVRHIFASKEFSDITFIVRGERFKAHKLILASRSTELARLLMSPNAADEIVVDRASPVTVTGFKILLNFIYTNELNTTNKKSIVEGYLAAKYYKQRALQIKCKEEIESWEINADEVCDLLNIEWDIPELNDRCISFVRSNGIAVISSDSFTKASFKALSAILQSEALKDVPLLRRIEYIMIWGKNQYTSFADYSPVREQLLNAKPPLLGMLEFEKLSLQELREIPKRYPNLLTAEEVMKFLIHSSTKDAADLPDWCIAAN